MFCNQCGGQVPEDAAFCNHCGRRASAGVPREASRLKQLHGPALVLKPVFVPAMTLATTSVLALFTALWCAGFFGGFSMFVIRFFRLPVPGWLPFVSFGLFALVAVPLLTYRASQRTYAETEYRFYPDKLEYYEGFFTVEEKTVPLASVVEVHLRKGVLQKKYGLGTVVLSTPATAHVAGRSGIRITDVANPDDVYANVKALVERARNENRPAA